MIIHCEVTFLFYYIDTRSSISAFLASLYLVSPWILVKPKSLIPLLSQYLKGSGVHNLVLTSRNYTLWTSPFSFYLVRGFDASEWLAHSVVPTQLLFMVSIFKDIISLDCWVINSHRIHIYRFQFCCSELGLWGFPRNLFDFTWTVEQSIHSFYQF